MPFLFSSCKIRIFKLMEIITRRPKNILQYVFLNISKYFYIFSMRCVGRVQRRHKRNGYYISAERKQNTSRKPKIESYINKHRYKRIKLKHLS